jgi:SAM-dependent methyltransferase
MYWKAVRRSLGVVKFELLCHLCSIVGFAKAKTSFDRSAPNRIEIGAGGVKRSGFETVDLGLSCDYPFDLRLGLPFPDGSIDFIYAEHVLEHFSIRDLMHLLKDCRRVLRAEGRLSMAVPDARLYVDAYCGDGDFEAFRTKFCTYGFGLPFQSRMDALNYMFYMDGLHRYMFDVDNARALLQLCGFSDASQREFDAEIDQEARRHESIYFLARP